MEIRTATDDDVEAIARLHRRTFDTTYPTFPELHSPEDDVAHFRELVATARVFVAMLDGCPVGYCAFGGGWLYDLYVALDRQGHGLGTRLLAMAKEESSELQLWTFQENTKARRFYEHNGFTAAELT